MKINSLLAGTLALVLVAGLGTPVFAGNAQVIHPPVLDCNTELVKLQTGSVSDIDQAIAFLNNPGVNPQTSFLHNGLVSFADDNGMGFEVFPPSQFRFEDIAILAPADNFAMRMNGFVSIPPGAAPNTHTFAVSSDDGFRLTINDGTNDVTAEFPGPRGIATGPLLQVTFPPAGGNFPLELAYFEGISGAILELSQASGDEQVFSTNIFTLVECIPAPQPVGGEFLSIDSTALILAGAQTNAVWIMSALAVIGSVAFGALYITSKKN